MDSLSSSLILLILALVLLWLAVTDRLSRVLDAVDVLRGNKASASANLPTGKTVAIGPVALSLPSLPVAGTSAQVTL